MPRLGRTVCARVPHHITQWGNRRKEEFFTDDDRLAYLAWLKDYALLRFPESERFALLIEEKVGWAPAPPCRYNSQRRSLGGLSF